MVTITIFIEGGVIAHQNDAAQTVDNSNGLREAFHKLFRNAFDDDELKLIVELKGGWKNTVTHFKNNYQPTSFLLIDLDDAEENKASKIVYYELEGFEQSSFFMIQKMEAWILSQIEKVDIYLTQNYKKIKAGALVNDESISGKDVKSFTHPDYVLKTIIARYFEIEKKGKAVKLKYGKLRHAPQLLEILDIEELRNTFTDVSTLLERISEP